MAIKYPLTINNNNMGTIFLALHLLTSSGSKNLSSQHAASIACEFAGTCKIPHLTKHGFNEVKIPWSQCRDITKETKTNQSTEHGQ